jgi:uncharacterized protein (DUF1015 family)
MPQIRPISAIGYPTPREADLSTKIAPPFDVQTSESKAQQLSRDPHAIVAIDLPYLPPKTVGPDHVYAEAGERYREWLSQGILQRRSKQALFAYQQVYKVGGKTFQRRGLIARVTVQPFGKDPVTGKGGVWPHEKTFREGTEDRIRLMRATRAQLSPVFGMYKDQGDRVGALLGKAIDRGGPDFHGTTAHDGTVHQVWAIDDPAAIAPITSALDGADIYIADGHHRYTTAWHYRDEVAEKNGGKLPGDHPANYVLMVLVSVDDPGMFILPTERVLGGMTGFSMEKLIAVAKGKLDIQPFTPGSGDLNKDVLALEASLPAAGHHAIGLYDPGSKKLYTATTTSADPLASTHADKSQAWRQLDVAIVQALLVEGICQPNFASGGAISWKYPQMDDFLKVAHQDGHQLGVIVQPTPLEAVLAVSKAGEVMPQKSTFFYPKLATGLVINPLDE